MGKTSSCQQCESVLTNRRCARQYTLCAITAGSLEQRPSSTGDTVAVTWLLLGREQLILSFKMFVCSTIFLKCKWTNTDVLQYSKLTCNEVMVFTCYRHPSSSPRHLQQNRTLRRSAVLTAAATSGIRKPVFFLQVWKQFEIKSIVCV
jgi:hypothetical protein